MAKTYQQKIHDDLSAIIDKYPNAKASDAILALEAMAAEIWHCLPKPKKGRKCIERTARYRLA
jgi:hypothetical protein